jgi:hypothetical protein
MNEITEGAVLISSDKKEYIVVKIIPYLSNDEYIGPDGYLLQDKERNLFFMYRYCFPLCFNHSSSKEIEEMSSRKGIDLIKRQLNWALEDYLGTIERYSWAADKTKELLELLKDFEEDVKS